MSTIKVINAIHPSGSTNNIVLDSFGNVTAGANLTFSASGARITGDFINATISNRVMFQNSVAGNTSVGVIPNGTDANGNFSAYNQSDPNNASRAQLAANGITDVRLSSDITGTGTYLPMTFYTGGSERARIDTSGNFYFNSGYGSAAPAYGIRAWGTFAGATGTLSASGNVTSVTRNTTGDYTVTLATAMPDANYAVMAMPVQYSAAETAAVMIKTGTTNTTTTFVLRASYNSSGAGYYDPTYVYFMVVR